MLDTRFLTSYSHQYQERIPIIMNSFKTSKTPTFIRGCGFCHSQDHDLANCKVLLTTECQNCGQMGHTRKKCKIETCAYCKSQDQPHIGHTKERCARLATTKCFNCGQLGHTPKYCKSPKFNFSRKNSEPKETKPKVESVTFKAEEFPSLPHAQAPPKPMVWVQPKVKQILDLPEEDMVTPVDTSISNQNLFCNWCEKFGHTDKTCTEE